MDLVASPSASLHTEAWSMPAESKLKLFCFLIQSAAPMHFDLHKDLGFVESTSPISAAPYWLTYGTPFPLELHVREPPLYNLNSGCNVTGIFCACVITLHAGQLTSSMCSVTGNAHTITSKQQHLPYSPDDYHKHRRFSLLPCKPHAQKATLQGMSRNGNLYVMLEFIAQRIDPKISCIHTLPTTI